MVDALGALGDPAAERPLLERLHDDEYVTVRVGAARALAEIGARDRGGGAARALAGRIELAVRHETEPTVIAAARQAAADLRAKRP